MSSSISLSRPPTKIKGKGMSHEYRPFCTHVQTVPGGQIVSYREYCVYGIKVKQHCYNCKKKKRALCALIVWCLNTGTILFLINKQKHREKMKTNKWNLNLLHGTEYCRSLHFISWSPNSEHSWQCSQQFTICSSPKPDTSSSAIPSYFFKIYCNPN
jgi:hypothetical protein